MNAKRKHVSCGEGRQRVTVESGAVGQELLVVISNENAHIGAVALAEYDGRAERVSTSVVTRLGHKDDAVATQAAHRLAKGTKRTVCVVAGIHIDHATAEDIRRAQENAAQAVNALLAGGVE